MNKNEIGLIGMSAGNSYFDENTIGKLLLFTGKKFNKLLIISPDKPAEHTFKALGYSENKAKRKAKLNANLLKNRAERAVKKLKMSNKFHFVNWQNEVIDNSQYRIVHKEITGLYDTNYKFRKDARVITQSVIGDKFNESTKIERATDEAVQYLIEELSFVLASPVIYGAEKVTYVYHNRWEIYENLIAGRYDQKKRKNLSFMLTSKRDLKTTKISPQPL